MLSSLPLRTTALALLLGGALLLPADAGEKAGDLPRYQLQVGQELVYEGSSQFKHTKGTLDSTNSFRVWDVAANKILVIPFLLDYSARPSNTSRQNAGTPR